MIFGMLSLPTPLSPVTKTEISVGATCMAFSTARLSLGSFPIISNLCFIACIDSISPLNGPPAPKGGVKYRINYYFVHPFKIQDSKSQISNSNIYIEVNRTKLTYYSLFPEKFPVESADYCRIQDHHT